MFQGTSCRPYTANPILLKGRVLKFVANSSIQYPGGYGKTQPQSTISGTILQRVFILLHGINQLKPAITMRAQRRPRRQFTKTGLRVSATTTHNAGGRR